MPDVRGQPLLPARRLHRLHRLRWNRLLRHRLAHEPGQQRGELSGNLDRPGVTDAMPDFQAASRNPGECLDNRRKWDDDVFIAPGQQRRHGDRADLVGDAEACTMTKIRTAIIVIYCTVIIIVTEIILRTETE